MHSQYLNRQIFAHMNLHFLLNFIVVGLLSLSLLLLLFHYYYYYYQPLVIAHFRVQYDEYFWSFSYLAYNSKV